MNAVDKSGFAPNIPGMNPISEFVAACDAAAAIRGIQRSTLSTMLFADGKRLDQLAGGKSDIGVRRLSAARHALAQIMHGQAHSGIADG